MTISIDMSRTGNFSDAEFTITGSTEKQTTVYLHEPGSGEQYATVLTRNGDFVFTLDGLKAGQHSFAIRTSVDNGQTFSAWVQLLNMNVGYSEKGENG
ncbi:hypothetical protein [Pseudomonas arsenicoxydans]|uniref:Bacterial Ig-like domain-containing protein n=1 Tax=Pseudomonas arsenicoxydans TaxID=702115 RepID=A0A4P6G3A3_9PSED|nr:hypothetical protein [Pseudomonas arsenicoxydans]QAY83800.1 hypothetical protein CUN61_07310 [Pseudomonas arsenicoxydans]